MTAEFTLSVHSYDSKDSASGFFDFRAAVACRGFSGQTAFSHSERDLGAFIADLASVQSAARDSALMLGGWDDASERLRLRIAPSGPFGHFLASIRIANTGPRSDQWQRVDTEFVCPPAALANFLAALQRLAAECAPGTATLIGDPDAIA